MGLQENLETEGGAVLVCVARGHGDDWQAFCLDFDLAVQGISLTDVRQRLEDATDDYVHAAMAEAEPARSQLMRRRAPLLIRLKWALRFFVGTVTGRNRDEDSTVGFPVTCHA